VLVLDAVLARGRAAAERRMRDECAFRRKTGTTTDKVTGQITPTYAAGYTGRCRVKHTSPQGSPAEAGEAVVVMLSLEVHIPMSGTPAPQVGDECVITASEGDPGLVGKVFVVETPHRHSDATARRLGVKERTS
jgi:hypothetical protein